MCHQGTGWWPAEALTTGRKQGPENDIILFLLIWFRWLTERVHTTVFNLKSRYKLGNCFLGFTQVRQRGAVNRSPDSRARSGGGTDLQ